jgi:hypothetical protein
MPANLQEGMHEREVAEWLQTDTNLVGCIERKACVIRAASYEEVRGRARRALEGGRGRHRGVGARRCGGRPLGTGPGPHAPSHPCVRPRARWFVSNESLLHRSPAEQLGACMQQRRWLGPRLG